MEGGAVLLTFIIDFLQDPSLYQLLSALPHGYFPLQGCRCVFELFAFLLPPFPRFENPSQVGKLTSPPDGWGVGTWDEGVRTHRRQPLHFLSVPGVLPATAVAANVFDLLA